RVGRALLPEHAVRLRHVVGAIRRSMTCTTPRAARAHSDRHDRGVRTRPGSAPCTGPKTPVVSLARALQVLLAQPPAQHAGRPPRLSSALARLDSIRPPIR